MKNCFENIINKLTDDNLTDQEKVRVAVYDLSESEFFIYYVLEVINSKKAISSRRLNNANYLIKELEEKLNILKEDGAGTKLNNKLVRMALEQVKEYKENPYTTFKI